MFKVLEPSMQELQELKIILSRRTVFNEKICKIKAFDAYSPLETCGVFLDNR